MSKTFSSFYSTLAEECLCVGEGRGGAVEDKRRREESGERREVENEKSGGKGGEEEGGRRSERWEDERIKVRLERV